MATPLPVRMLSGLHGFWYRLSGGRLGGRFGKAPVLLLHTRGRHSGKERVTPLMYVRDSDGYALMASNGGRPAHPAWYLNLQATPVATVEIGTTRRRVRAETASLEERARLWPRFVAIYKTYDAYQQKTSREIPVVLLRPE